MTVCLILAAIRRHPFGVVLTSMLTIVTALLLGVPVLAALAVWLGAGMSGFELWYLLEPTVLRRVAGCRYPSFAERERLDAAFGPTCTVLVDESPDLAFVRGLRCLVVSRDLLEVLEDRALVGLLNQAAAPLQVANLAGLALVWLGNLPALATWLVIRLVGLLARLLALTVGTCLVLPLVVWRDGFLRWAGRAFTCVIVGLLGASLLSSGFAAAGLGLMLTWLILPVVRSVLDWESRRAERSADRAVIAAGCGQQLLEAVDFLALAELRMQGSGLLSLLCSPGAPLVERAERVRRDLAVLHPVD